MAKPTPKQLAYLNHLGVQGVPETKQMASEWIERIHSGSGFTVEQNADLKSKMSSWEYERSSKHPELYPADPIYDFNSRLDIPEQDEIRGAIRRKVVGSSGRLTSEKLDATALEIWKKDTKWKERPNWKNTLIAELEIRHPECFDGRTPDVKARKSSGKTSAAGGKGCLFIFALCFLHAAAAVAFWIT